MPAPRRGSRRGVALAAAAVLTLTAACGDSATGADPTTPAPVATSPAPSPDPSPSPTTTPSPAPAPRTTSVYYLVDTRTGLRLAREPREVTADDPIRAAVEAMIAGPVDPDYSTAWDPATQVLGITRDGGTIVVDLSEEALTASVGSEAASLMVQQLVHTATEAAGDPDAGVLLTIGGEQGVDLWGVLVWDEPVKRTDPLSVRLLVQIDTPAQGATTASPVTVSGDAAVYEATLPWQVLDASGAVVASDFTMTAEGQTFAPYSFDVDLEPGTYTVVISESDPSAGEGGAVMTDSRTVTVE